MIKPLMLTNFQWFLVGNFEEKMKERIKKLENAKKQQIKHAEDRLEKNISAMKTRFGIEIEQINKRFDSEINAAKLADTTKPDPKKLN